MGGAVEVSRDRLQLLRRGPIIQIAIGHPKAEYQEAVALGLDLPKPQSIHALIDTGASVTIVNPEVAKTCRLRQTGMASIQAAGHKADYPEFAASIDFPGSGLKSLEIIRVVACPLASVEMSCLLGRDVLYHWELLYNGYSGRVVVKEVS